MKRFFTSRWTWSFIGALILALLVWFLGPLLDFLVSWIVRAAICLAILLIWGLTNFLLDRRRKKADDDLAKGVAATTPADSARTEEVAAMRDKLTQALSLLRKASGARGYLYEQPWYVIIGPPGAGKTTALLNAGLKFPLAAEMGQGAVAGVGGTRMCDWWFTEDAVLIDTAGRYTTQDSDAAVDRAGWEGFLDLLKRTRARQPLNGVLVAISAPELAQAAPPERLEHARAVRRRVKELNDKLGLKLPVYALFTKTDLLSGFTEYFDDLDRDKRDQVWGETFDLATKNEADGPVARWTAAIRGLLERLNKRVVDRLQAERSPDRRALLAGFPAQFASLETPLGEFLTEAFGGSRLDPAPWLRGVYFTSGTQAGTPIDRLTGTLSHLFGIDQRRTPSLIPTQGRSYFLGGLLRDVIFGEAMLATTRPGAGRQRSLARTLGFVLVALLTVGLAAAFIITRSQQVSDAQKVSAALTQYDQTSGAQPLDPVTGGDLNSVLPLLDQARALPYGTDHPDAGGFHWGLSQSDKYAEGTNSLYQRALERVLLPRLLVRLEGQMRSNLQKPDFLYESLHVYLMLGGQGPLDPDLTRAWEQLDWQTLYPDPAEQADLTKHLNALLQAPLPAVSLDGGLIADARSALSREPVATRVYSQIKLSGPAQAEPAWTPASAVGPTGLAVFTRVSGKPLSDGIPGFYTVQGFHDVLLPSLPVAAAQVASESWVLGKQSEVPTDAAAMQQLQTDVVQLYEKDYETQWDAMLADLNIAPLGNATQTSQTLYILASPQSPFGNLMTSIAKQLKLSKNPNPAATNAATSALSKLGGSTASRLSGLLGPSTPQIPPGTDVDNYYKPFLDYVGGGPGSGAPIDLTLKLLSDLQQQVSAVASAGAGGAAAPAGGNNPGQLLQAEAGTQPAAVQNMIKTLTGGSTQVVNGNARKAIEDAYNAPGGPGTLCHLAVDGRYPFTPGATSEIPIQDFARLFAPGGQLDSFFTGQLRPFVTTSGRTWTLQPVNGVAAPISAGNLAEFQRAASIRDLFFAAGATPSVSFTIEPESLDDTTKQATLTLGATTVTYAHGPTQPMQIMWPGQGMDSVRLTLTPAPPGATGVFSAEGPWALFRLIAQGTLTPGGSPDLYTLTFTQADRHVTYQLRAGSVLNPFAPGVLQDFRCPSIQ